MPCARKIGTNSHVAASLDFVATQCEAIKHPRGAIRSALGYRVRQRQALLTFLDDGRPTSGQRT